jgi:hypothetical protein
VRGKETTTDADAAKEWYKEKLKDVLRGYIPKNIYNTDRIKFFVRCYQIKLAYRGEKCASGKKNKKRLTSLFCCNSTST